MPSNLLLPMALAVLGSLFAIGFVFYAGWTALTVMFLFWAESATLGLVTLGKILVALPGYDPVPGRSVTYSRGDGSSKVAWSTSQPRGPSLVLGFVVFYGGFLAIVGWFGAAVLSGGSWDAWHASLAALREQTGGIALVLLVLFAQQAVSACFDLVHGPNWARRDPLFQTGRIWGRAIGLYLLFFLAAFMVGLLRLPRGFLVVFIAVKTLVELFAISVHVSVRGEWRRSFPNDDGEPDGG